MTTPRLTIGVPVYNGEDYIAEAITSHLEQDFTDFELIVSDNCSDDSTPEIVKEFVEADSRVTYSRNTENVGGPANFNRLFRLGQGELFRWAAADDRIEPGYLSKVIAMMDDDPAVAIGHSEALLIDPTSEPMLKMDRGYLGGDGFLEAIRLTPPPGDERFRSPKPHNRIDAVINNNHRNFYIFGIMRRNLMMQTRLHGLFYGGDRTLLVEMTGAQVRTLLQIGTSGAHGILQLAGAAVSVDPQAEGGRDLDGDGALADWERIRLCDDVRIGDRSLDDAATYTVVTSDFLFTGGDHLGPAFEDATVVDEGPLLREVFYAYAEATEGCIADTPLIQPDAPRIGMGACP